MQFNLNDDGLERINILRKLNIQEKN